MMQIKGEKAGKRKFKNQRNGVSDTTSNASGTVDGGTFEGSRASTANKAARSRRKSILIARKPTSKTVKLDQNECIVQVTHQLPYRLISKEPGQFTTDTSYQTPSLLYGNLDELTQTKAYNFVWVGIVVTKHQMTASEEE